MINPAGRFSRFSPAPVLWLIVGCLNLCRLASGSDEPFRPEPGKFPPVEKARSYRGELVFVDHPHRRGSLRIAGEGKFRMNAPHPFALLPYAVVRYQGAPADLRDIPLGTVLHARAFLPPDPKTSAVPVLPPGGKGDGGYGSTGAAPAENHVILLEDEPSHCLSAGLAWRIEEVEVEGSGGVLVARRAPKHGDEGGEPAETLTFDAATRIWRGRECVQVGHLIDEGIWPEAGKRSLGGQPVQLGLIWKPTLEGVFTRFHVSDLWLDDVAMERSANRQKERHKTFVRSRWMPAWVDAVEYGQFGRATVSVTLFGGMDESLYADFKNGLRASMNGAENTLKHAGGHYGPGHLASGGRITEVVRTPGPIPLGSSGIQIRFETDLIIEGIRPGRIVRVRPEGWPDVHPPREEYLGDGTFDHEDRFPTPAIFPRY